MKRIVYLVVFFLFPGRVLAAVPMARVLDVITSRQIRVEVAGQQSTVALTGVEISAEEESGATEYLHRLLDGTWVYVENGSVYRSPDGLYINGELQRRAWRASSNMHYLGISNPGPAKEPARSGKVASPSESRRRVPARRSPARYRR
jgi:hypothetical protein